MNTTKLIFLLLFFLGLGGAMGYFFGYDIGVEKFSIKNPATQQTQNVKPEDTKAGSAEQEQRAAKAMQEKKALEGPSCTVCDDLPVVVYIPSGIFTDEEKTDLQNKMVNPFFDFNNASEINFVTMVVEKFEPVPAHGYKYSIDAINKDGGYIGFLFGQSAPLEWWLPECMGGCELSAEFIAKYPEITDQLE